MTGLEHTLQDVTKPVAVPLNESNNYWSSTEHSQYRAYRLGTYDGGVDNFSKDYYYLVRAFCRLPRI